MDIFINRKKYRHFYKNWQKCGYFTKIGKIQNWARIWIFLQKSGKYGHFYKIGQKYGYFYKIGQKYGYFYKIGKNTDIYKNCILTKIEKIRQKYERFLKSNFIKLILPISIGATGVEENLLV